MTGLEAFKDVLYILSAVSNNEIDTNCETIKTIEKSLKALDIIKEKNVNVGLVKVLGSVEQYNQTYVYDNMLNVKWCLTEEEFDLLKEVLENE